MLRPKKISSLSTKNNLMNLFIITILALTLSILINIENLDQVNAQINTTNTLAQFNPGRVIVQPPLDADTGQVIKLPGTLEAIKNADTGQIEIENIRLQPPIVEGGSITGDVGLSSLLNNPTLSPPSSILGSNLIPNEAIGLSSVLSSKTAVATTAPGPTYNPPLKECPTGDPKATTTLGGFDIAKYVITGKLNKDKIKGDKFAFNIFSDLVKNDGAEIKGKDAPFKANYATEDGDKIADIDLDEIATVCIDTAKIVNVDEKTDIDLEDSTLFESLEYDD